MSADSAPRALGAHVAQLARYPVKACAAELLSEVEVGLTGLRNDRTMAVVAGGRVLTQRELPVLARIRPDLDDSTGRLTLWLTTAEGVDAPEPVQGVVRTDGRPVEVALFGERVSVVEQSGAFSTWLTRVLGSPATLVAAPETTWRTSPGEVAGRTVLADEATVSLLSRASLARLNEALAEQHRPPVAADRFRANILLDGCSAHAEDDARRIEAGSAVLRFAQLDARCVVTTVDQSRGERTGPEPLRTLSLYRRGSSGGVHFGVYAAVERAGVLRAGDPVTMRGE